MCNYLSVPTWSLLLFFCQIPQKIAMLTSMTKSFMNVTYHDSNISKIFTHRKFISIHASNNLSTISPFDIDGNIDEKHLVPRIPTKRLFIFFSNPLHQSFSPIDIPQFYFCQTIILCCTFSEHIVFILNFSNCNSIHVFLHVKILPLWNPCQRF